MRMLALTVLVLLGGFAAVGLASPYAASAQEGQEQQAPTPMSTVVRPVVVTVSPQQTVVAPIQSAAEARTEDAARSLAGDQSGDNIFTGVRGGLVGASIGFGAVVALAVAVSAVRRGFRRQRQ